MKALIPILIAVAGCGAHDSSSRAASAPKHSLAIADATALPACDAAGEGWLVYLKAEAKFQVCASGAWADVDIKGEKGADGAAGKDGADNHIVSSIGCFGIVEEGISDVGYTAAITSAGDIFVSAYVRNAVFQASGSEFYAASQKGAKTGAVIVTNDMVGAVNFGSWTMELDRKTLILSVSYKDADGNSSYSMTPDKCTVNKY